MSKNWKKKNQTIHCQIVFEGVKNSNTQISPKIAEMTWNEFYYGLAQKGESKTKSQHFQKPKKTLIPTQP